MRTPDGGIKILDFGLARVEGAGAGTLTAVFPGAMAGTPAYMAPEQIEGRSVGPAADVFAFGVLMYEWICGRHPFQAGTPLATLARVMESTPEPLCKCTDVPLWLSEVIDRCLRKPAGERYGARQTEASGGARIRSWRSRSTSSPAPTRGRSRSGCASRPRSGCSC